MWGSIPARAGETIGYKAPDPLGWVYPRTGGGNPFRSRRNRSAYGLSPHGRGKPRRAIQERQARRSIPARAGETVATSNQRTAPAVYPRTGGGNCAGQPVPSSRTGLSPHGRGKHVPGGKQRPAQRSIPARAGETGSGSAAGIANRVYPRTGGGNRYTPQVVLPSPGLSPHGRGKPLPTRSICGWTRVYPRTGGGNLDGTGLPTGVRGLSPHGRGKHSANPHFVQLKRSIPARAGETEPAAHQQPLPKVYPRTGGGNRVAGWLGALGLRSIPARAGETRLWSRRCRIRQVYPRTGGGNRTTCGPLSIRKGLSPHGRGKPHRVSQGQDSVRSIPARAGETRPPAAARVSIRVYPRTGGGNPVAPACPCCPGGLSPHGRGKRGTPPPNSPSSRSIPARAGETAAPSR